MKWQYRIERITFPFTQSDLRQGFVRRLEAALRPDADAEIHVPAAEDMLNNLGRDGWELVSICAETNGLLAVFKRPNS